MVRLVMVSAFCDVLEAGTVAVDAGEFDETDPVAAAEEVTTS